MVNNGDQRTAHQPTGSDDAGETKYQARIQELKGKGYPDWWAESQALSELRFQAEVKIDDRPVQWGSDTVEKISAAA